MSDTITMKLRAGEYFFPVKVIEYGEQLRLSFGYNKSLLAEIKSMAGARWHPTTCDCRICKVHGGKSWTITNNHRNKFQLKFLAAKSNEDSPYYRYDLPLDYGGEPKPIFNKALQKEVIPYAHQHEMQAHIFTRKQSIVCGEMGVGKTLADFIATRRIIETYGWNGWWYVAPKSVIRAIERELYIWGFPIEFRPKLMTYESLVKTMEEWKTGQRAPQKVTFDESARLKTPTSQRSQAAKALADGIRQDWGDEGYVVLMSGTPAPKSPADWFFQCEVACPGFLKEGDIFKFRNRLGIIKQVQSITGGIFPQLVTWKDDSNKCDICGKLKADHSDEAWLSGVNTDAQHVFKESKNEILGLYERLKGLVIIKWKKDCLDLPEKRYREIEVKPSGSILRLAGVLAKSSKTTIEGLTKLRELSDGFQYIEKEVGTKQCEHCLGTFEVIEKFEIPGTCPNCSKERNEYGQCMNHIPQYEDKVVKCPTCGGSGEVKRFERDVKRVDCPKDDALVDLLDEYSDVGRVVIYGGFTGTIDRIVDLCHNQDWCVVRVDQGKWITTNPKNEMITLDPLELFQNKTPEHLEKYPRVAFVAHPMSGGEGLTLTASPVIIYYSNTFDGNSRVQSEDRIHRMGMDQNRGATIVDILHLPSDRKVLQNLRAKRKLELLSLGELTDTLDSTEERKI